MESPAPAQDPVDSPGDGTGEPSEAEDREDQEDRQGTAATENQDSQDEDSQGEDEGRDEDESESASASASVSAEADDDGDAEEPKLQGASKTSENPAPLPSELKVRWASAAETVPEMDLSAHRGGAGRSERMSEQPTEGRPRPYRPRHAQPEPPQPVQGFAPAQPPQPQHQQTQPQQTQPQPPQAQPPRLVPPPPQPQAPSWPPPVRPDPQTQPQAPPSYAQPPQHHQQQYGYEAPQAYLPPQQAYHPVPDYGPHDEHTDYRAEQNFPAAYGDATKEKRGRKKLRITLITLLVLVLLAGAGAAGQVLRPLPEPTMRLTLPTNSHTFSGTAPQLPLPANGQSVLHVEGLGTMASSGNATPIPTASVAKVMTAYVFLREHPLGPGRNGPTYTVSPQGVAEMPGRQQRGESILGIKPGMRLTERKALEALMLISANDVAHELARWDAGTLQAFVRKMNRTARSLGMTRTVYTDPSGYHSGTVSTAADQVKLLRAAMRLPAFAEIVSRRMFVPGDGTQPRPNGNVLLGQHGVMGGKTGYTDAAGGNFVFAARRRVGGSDLLFLGAVMGQRTQSAMGAIYTSGSLLAAAQRSVTAVTLARPGAQVGTISDGLGGRTPVTARSAITVVGWPGLTVRLGYQDSGAEGLPHTGAAGTAVGTLKTGMSGVPLVLGQDLREPAVTTRLTRTDF